MKKLTESEIRTRIKNNFELDYGFDSIKKIPENKEELINLKCPLHGIFTKKLKDLLRKVGCNECSKKLRASKKFKSKEYYVEISHKIHYGFYDYSKFIYNKCIDKGIITCPIHGDFEQSFHHHVNLRRGCSDCGRKMQGYSKSKFVKFCERNNNGIGTLYIIRCFNENEEFYKIGRTSVSIKTRFSGSKKMPYQYEIVQEIQDKSENIFDLEYILHAYFKSLKYCPLKKFKGHNECFKYEQ